MHIKSGALASFLLLASMPVHAANVKNVHKTIPLRADGSVSIDTHNGSVTVTTWNQPTVDVIAKVEAEDRWGEPEDVEKTEIRVSGGGNTVRIESDYKGISSHVLGWLGIGSGTSYPLVHYTIHMPANARLDIDNHNSRVDVTGLHNDLVIRSHNGPVEVRDLDGLADIETHNGNVRVDFAQFRKASRLTTHNGSFDVRIPAATRFTVDIGAHKSDPVTSEFALARNRGDDSDYGANINGGGPVLHFSAHNGSLHLGKL